MKKELANFLTYLRLASTPVVALLLLHDMFLSGWIFFCFVCTTDYFDGFFAKKWQFSSPFGAFLDAFADKVFVATVGLTLVSLGHISGIHLAPFAIILWREIFISSIRMLPGPTPLAFVKNLPRIKTFFQMSALGFLIGSFTFPALHALGLALLWISTAITLLSVWPYWARVVQFCK